MLKEFIGGADIYITPYLNEAQITSGTLAYSFGSGKAVISTPYWHAQELLAEARMWPFADAAAIERRQSFPLASRLMTAMRKRESVKLDARWGPWPVVARRYMESFERARASPECSPRRPRSPRASWKMPTTRCRCCDWIIFSR